MCLVEEMEILATQDSVRLLGHIIRIHGYVIFVFFLYFLLFSRISEFGTIRDCDCGSGCIGKTGAVAMTCRGR